jgi:hypothetical protein
MESILKNNPPLEGVQATVAKLDHPSVVLTLELGGLYVVF